MSEKLRETAQAVIDKAYSLESDSDVENLADELTALETAISAQEAPASQPEQMTALEQACIDVAHVYSFVNSNDLPIALERFREVARAALKAAQSAPPAEQHPELRAITDILACRPLGNPTERSGEVPAMAATPVQCSACGQPLPAGGCGFRGKCAATPMPLEPVAPNNDEVICPKCAHQFRAIPVNVQALLLASGHEPPFLSAQPPSADAALKLLNSCKLAMQESMRYYGQRGTNWTHMIAAIDAAMGETHEQG